MLPTRKIITAGRQTGIAEFSGAETGGNTPGNAAVAAAGKAVAVGIQLKYFFSSSNPANFGPLFEIVFFLIQNCVAKRPYFTQ